MLRDRITVLIDRLDMIKENADLIKKQSDQKNLDDKYRELVFEFEKLIETYINVSKLLDFKLSEEGRSMLQNVLKSIKEIIKNGKVQKSRLEEFDRIFKKLKSVIKKEWQSYYNNKTENIKVNLNQLCKIKPDLVNRMLLDINAVQNWDLINSRSVKTFVDALSEAGKFINENSEDYIIEFLNKVTTRNATLADITPEIFEWIKRENLIDKIYISSIK